MKMRAVKHFRYAGRPYKPGDELEMRDSHANTFERIKNAVRVKEVKTSTYKRRDMVAEQPAPPLPMKAPPASEPEAPAEPLDIPKKLWRGRNPTENPRFRGDAPSCGDRSGRAAIWQLSIARAGRLVSHCSRAIHRRMAAQRRVLPNRRRDVECHRLPMRVADREQHRQDGIAPRRKATERRMGGSHQRKSVRRGVRSSAERISKSYSIRAAMGILAANMGQHLRAQTPR